VIALTVLLGGWLFQVAVLRSFGHGNVDMVANTSLALVLGSLALIAHLLDARVAQGNTLGRILSLGVAVIALATLYEWVTDTGLAIDHLLFTPAPGSLGAPYLGRIAPNVVVALLLVSGGLELSLTGRRAALRRCFLLAAAAIALVAVLGYASQVPTLYGGAVGTEMALPASLALLALAVGILASQPADGLASHLTRRSPGARLARRLLPAVIGIPTILSVFLFVSRRTGLVGTNVGIWLIVLLTIALCCGVTVVYARALDSAE